MNELLKRIIFSDVKKPAAEYEELYAARGESAKVVTRLGPSPTGFIYRCLSAATPAWESCSGPEIPAVKIRAASIAFAALITLS